MKTLKSINKLAYLVTTLCTSLIFAQEEASWLKGFKLSGNADIFYKADFAGSDNNTKTSFTQPNNSFELGMFSLKAYSYFREIYHCSRFRFWKQSRTV